MIKNNLKLIALVGLVIGMAGVNGALAADLNFTADTTVTINSNNYTIAAGSAATSMIVGATNLTVTVPAASTFTLISLNKYLLNNSTNVAQQCTATQSSLSIGTGTVVITPSAVACAAPVTIVPSGGGTPAAAAPAAAAPAAAAPAAAAPAAAAAAAPAAAVPTAPVTIPALPANATISDISVTLSAIVQQVAYIQAHKSDANALSLLQAVVQRLVEVQKALGTPVSTSEFTELLPYGSTSEDVKNLQNFLKSQGTDIYPEGLVTGYFGPMTLKAVQRFQEKYGIADPSDAGYGVFGPKTRAKTNTLLGL